MKNDGLDPQDWDEYRAAAHRLLDQCIDRLASARDLPWQPVPQATREAYALTGAGSTESALAARIARDILPYGHGNTHPAFFGWVRGTGLATGIMSEMAVATMNANTGGGD